MEEETITWKCPYGHANNSVELYYKGHDKPWHVKCSIYRWEKNV
ncbi:MAG TPA: hypothetical protein VIO11_08330 [Candidatus Methanoperedens sp.]